MKTHKNKIAFIVSGLVVGALILAVILTKNYPAIFVGLNYISAKSLDNYVTIAKQLDPNSSEQQAVDQLIKNYKEQMLASKLKIAVTKGDLDREFDYLTGNSKEQYQELIKQYFNGDESQFRNLVIAPQANEAALRVKYNSDFAKNQADYDQVSSVLRELNNGTSFEELAKSSSDDKVSGQLGGDLGFVTETEILPELASALKNSAIGEVNKQIIISRLGYHIIYPMEVADKDGQKLWYLKQIFIETSGFESWLSSEISKFKVWQIK